MIYDCVSLLLLLLFTVQNSYKSNCTSTDTKCESIKLNVNQSVEGKRLLYGQH